MDICSFSSFWLLQIMLLFAFLNKFLDTNTNAIQLVINLRVDCWVYWDAYIQL